MTSQANAIDPEDPVLQTSFGVELVRQMRAFDTYGRLENKTNAELLDPFILTAERKREIPIIANPDAAVLDRLSAFYNAIAAMIEKECNLMASPMTSLSAEGFGRGLIIVGKLVVMDRALRDVHRFGFASLSKMKDEADKVLSVALELIGNHSEVAGL
ncbi:NifX-associated nitrogen fixation protein [Thiorhodovibrio frisius]|uniref:Putative nitrogen fixation protein n=1 Tax=Thiorhodovibrio frisius TaxID=631362 RepID=H8Z573_9GAMM|nr:NifX-associated nitrogen fixation protein [Thiorhodovibrio frisius]EIC20480.1 putative nitrogen fixation protein [Thiorhodovibrio frisius]WPL21221.1 putative nitrogen fixation protein [Thiorhodovibrio frisius]